MFQYCILQPSVRDGTISLQYLILTSAACACLQALGLRYPMQISAFRIQFVQEEVLYASLAIKATLSRIVEVSASVTVIRACKRSYRRQRACLVLVKLKLPNVHK
jgi:hypothetical protein